MQRREARDFKQGGQGSLHESVRGAFGHDIDKEEKEFMKHRGGCTSFCRTGCERDG